MGLTIQDNMDGTWTASGPDNVVTLLDATSFEITSPSAVMIDDDTYSVESYGAMIETSILKSIKKLLGIDAAYTVFDQDIIMHINSVFMTLMQLGVGPPEGFSINDDTEEWDNFIGSRTDLASVKSFVYLSVRLLFDPPSTSFAIAAIEKLIAMYEWRLNVQIENAILLEGAAPNDY